jgi:hypothetical protein
VSLPDEIALLFEHVERSHEALHEPIEGPQSTEDLLAEVIGQRIAHVALRDATLAALRRLAEIIDTAPH